MLEHSKVCCRFEFLYKQAVTCTDAFLGIMDKDASSACCEDLELRIDLPQANSLSGNPNHSCICRTCILDAAHHATKMPSITSGVLLCMLKPSQSGLVCFYAELDLDVQALKILLASPA